MGVTAAKSAVADLGKRNLMPDFGPVCGFSQHHGGNKCNDYIQLQFPHNMTHILKWEAHSPIYVADLLMRFPHEGAFICDVASGSVCVANIT